uniref:Uncharacterized protein n=1 Tax=Plectus sambesii TaxID=2011161 RepID=A0A914VMT9_9BILA
MLSQLQARRPVSVASTPRTAGRRPSLIRGGRRRSGAGKNPNTIRWTPSSLPPPLLYPPYSPSYSPRTLRQMPDDQATGAIAPGKQSSSCQRPRPTRAPAAHNPAESKEKHRHARG